MATARCGGSRQTVGATVYDVAQDDDRFLMTRLVGSDEDSGSLILGQNFLEELKARVPN